MPHYRRPHMMLSWIGLELEGDYPQFQEYWEKLIQ